MFARLQHRLRTRLQLPDHGTCIGLHLPQVAGGPNDKDTRIFRGFF